MYRPGHMEVDGGIQLVSTGPQRIHSSTQGKQRGVACPLPHKWTTQQNSPKGKSCVTLEQRGERLSGRKETFTVNLPSFFWNVTSLSDSFQIVGLLQFVIKGGLRNLWTRLCYITLHTEQTLKRANRSLAACHLCVPGLLSLAEYSWLLPRSPVLLRAPGSYLSHLQLSAG